jgi:putative oxidoreductase
MTKLNTISIATWGLTGLLALAFAGAGVAKIMGVEQTVLPFERLGVPSLAIVVGLLEIAGAIGLFIPRLRFLAALALSATMVGAIGYHLILDPEMAALPGVVLLVLCVSLVWLRRPLAV